MCKCTSTDMRVLCVCVYIFRPSCVCSCPRYVGRTGRLKGRTATHCDTLQHTATHCNTLQHSATHTLQHTATHCNTLRHTATHCNTLQHTATHCNTPQHTATHTLQHTASVLQCVAVDCMYICIRTYMRVCLSFYKYAFRRIWGGFD